MASSFKGRVILYLGLALSVFIFSIGYILIEIQEVHGISQRLYDLRKPTTNASQGMEPGIQESLAGLRAWLLLKNDHSKKDRLNGWSRIDSNLEIMNTISENWTSLENKARLEKMNPLVELFRQYQVDVEKTALTNTQEAIELLERLVTPTGKKILLILNEMVTNQKLLISDDMNEMNRKVHLLVWTLAFVGIFALTCMVCIGYFLIKSIVYPLQEAVESANRISELNLNTAVEISGPAEIEELSRSLDRMRSNLNDFQTKILALNEELTQFSYRTSHDLRAPLITVSGLASAICSEIDEKSYDNVKVFAIKISEHVRKLENLVVDILNLARADLENLEVKEFKLKNTVETIKDKLEKLFIDNDVRIEIKVDSAMSLKMPEVRVSQILENFISNSIKYHDSNKEFSFVKISSIQRVNEVEIIIEDNGLGIPDEFQDRAFQMFQRFHPSISFGSGLGMYLIKKHIDNLNGDIRFESSDKGTVFYITIPAFNDTVA